VSSCADKTVAWEWKDKEQEVKKIKKVEPSRKLHIRSLK
jgi:hypothetical protein